MELFAGNTRDPTTVASQVEKIRTLLDDLSDVVVNTVRLPGTDGAGMPVVTRRTGLQRRAFELLEVNPDQTVPISVTG